MSSTSVVVGMFETAADAARARTDLLNAGLPAGSVSMHPEAGEGDASTAGGTAGAGTDRHADEGLFSRFLHAIFGPDDEDMPNRSGYAASYTEAMRRGHHGVTVQVRDDTELQRVEEILNAAGAIDLDERSERWRSEGWNGGSTGASASAAQGTGGEVAAGDTRTLPLVEEELKVGKRVVSRGGVRIVSRTLEVPVQESVLLREEHANVERRAVDRPATEADFAAFQEGTIEVRNTAEEAVVSKSARVVGEVEVSKQATETRETVNDTVRKTQVDVEPVSDGSRTGNAAAATGGTAGTTGTTGSTGMSGTTGTTDTTGTTGTTGASPRAF